MDRVLPELCERLAFPQLLAFGNVSDIENRLVGDAGRKVLRVRLRQRAALNDALRLAATEMAANGDAAHYFSFPYAKFRCSASVGILPRFVSICFLFHARSISSIGIPASAARKLPWSTWRRFARSFAGIFMPG